MSNHPGQPSQPRAVAFQKERIWPMLEQLVFPGEDRPGASFENLMARARDLWRRKQAMEGTKSETRDLLGEVFFSRLRSTFRQLETDPKEEIRSAEWVLRMLFAGNALTQFATELDRAMLEASRPEDFSFAGRADFISVEEVLQLLSSGGYSGMLGIEKDDNRIDVYIDKGKIVFLDPHHLVRRVLPGANTMSYREVPADMIRQAEARKSETGVPLLVALHELGIVEAEELRDLIQHLGLEVFYEFLSEQGACTFFYKKLEQMKGFVTDHGQEMPVTPILLEGSKRMDDWLVMKKVFPDPDQPLVPVDDMFARISTMNLGVLEIKMLAMINGDISPRQLAPEIGLPLFEVYEHLVRYAREGVLITDGAGEVLQDISIGLEETMAKAFEALDANDDELVRESALDALADPFAGGDSGEGSGTESFLDILANADLEQRGRS